MLAYGFLSKFVMDKGTFWRGFYETARICIGHAWRSALSPASSERPDHAANRTGAKKSARLAVFDQCWPGRLSRSREGALDGDPPGRKAARTRAGLRKFRLRRTRRLKPRRMGEASA